MKEKIKKLWNKIPMFVKVSIFILELFTGINISINCVNSQNTIENIIGVIVFLATIQLSMFIYKNTFKF